MSRGDSSLGRAGMEFVGDDRDFQKVADRVERVMEGVAQKMREAAKVVEAGFSGVAKPIEDATAGLVKFAINISMVTRAATGVKDIGKAAGEMAAKFREGAASFGELIDKMIEGIPVVGDFWEGGRGIHEAISGEMAYSKVIEAQIKLQEEWIAVNKQMIEGKIQLSRVREDAAASMGVGPGGPLLGRPFSRIVTEGRRGIEDAATFTTAEYEKQLEKIENVKRVLGQKLADFKRDNPIVISAGGMHGGMTPIENTAAIKEIARMERQLDALGNKGREVEEKMAGARRALADAAQGKMVTKSLQLAGADVLKAIEPARDAVARYVAQLPVMRSATARAVEGATTEWQKYKNKVADFAADLGRGLIGKNTFDRLAGRAFWDVAGKALDDYVTRAKSQFTVLGILIDGALGAPLSRVTETAKRVLQSFGIVAGGRALPKVPEFRASFEGLSDLGRRIQEGAGSLSAQQVDLARQNLKANQDNGRKLDAINQGVRAPRRAVAG